MNKFDRLEGKKCKVEAEEEEEEEEGKNQEGKGRKQGGGGYVSGYFVDQICLDTTRKTVCTSPSQRYQLQKGQNLISILLSK